jgi:hypothetical protein
MKNQDEIYVRDIANMIQEVSARSGTHEEDCGYHKADVVIGYQGNIYYIQVSHTPKSKRELRKLSKRGTHPIHTHRFQGMPLAREEIMKNIEKIIGF